MGFKLDLPFDLEETVYAKLGMREGDCGTTRGMTEVKVLRIECTKDFPAVVMLGDYEKGIKRYFTADDWGKKFFDKKHYDAVMSSVIIEHGKHRYEIVDEIPEGYSVWNIGKNAPEGYLPLCKPNPDRKNGCSMSVDVNSLKAIKCEGALEIMDAICYGNETLEEMRLAVERGKRKDATRYDVWSGDKCRTAIPYLESVPGAENLVDFK